MWKLQATVMGGMHLQKLGQGCNSCTAQTAAPECTLRPRLQKCNRWLAQFWWVVLVTIIYLNVYLQFGLNIGAQLDLEEDYTR